MCALFFTYFGPFFTFQGLWGYSFLTDVFKYDKLQASNLIMVIAFGVILGGPLLSHLTDKAFSQSKRLFLFIYAVMQVIIWSCIVFLGPSLGFFTLSLIFFFMGMIMAGTLALGLSIIQEASPPEKLGTMIGLTTSASFLGIALFQPLTGYLMDRVGRTQGVFPFEAYQQAFTSCLVSVSIAWMISFLLLKKSKRG